MGKTGGSATRPLRLLPAVLPLVALVACSRSQNRTDSASRYANDPAALANGTVTATDPVKAIGYEIRTVTRESPNGATKNHRASPSRRVGAANRRPSQPGPSMSVYVVSEFARVRPS
jgi:hypothetical protein